MSLDQLGSKLIEIDDSKIIYRDWARIDLRQLLINSFNSFLHYTRAGQGDYEPTLINDRVYYGDEDIEFNIYYKSYETIKELLGGQNA